MGILDFLFKKSHTNYESKYKMAENKFFEKEFTEAIEILTSLISEYPQYQYYGLRGSCYFELGKLEKALTDYSKSIEVEPSKNKNSMAYNRISQIEGKNNNQTSKRSKQVSKKQTKTKVIECYLINGINKFCLEEEINVDDLKKEIGLDLDNENDLLENSNKPNLSPTAKEIIDKIYIPYKISQSKRRGNRSYKEYFLEHGHGPEESPFNTSELSIQNKLLSYLSSPSLKILLKEEKIFLLAKMGVFNLIDPKIKTFPFRPVFLFTIPDVILWYYDSATFGKIKRCLNINISQILDEEGFVSTETCVKLINIYCNETRNKLECRRSWD